MNAELEPDAGQDPASPADRAFLATYEELRRLAHQIFTREPKDQTLQATALVHEAFLRLQSCGDATASDPVRFRKAAAIAIRRILIEHARSRRGLKRGGGQLPLSLDSVELASTGNLDQVLLVDEAIERLASEDPDLAEIVRLRFYAGLAFQDIASALDRSLRSVKRDWSFAKTRLFQYLRLAE